jgi:hypothetical protein
MLDPPNYLEVHSATGELLPHVQRLDDDKDIDAIIVRGGWGRLSGESRKWLAKGTPGSQGRQALNFGEHLLRLLVPDLGDLKAFYREAANRAMPDFALAGGLGILAVDQVRMTGACALPHVDEVFGNSVEKNQIVRAVSSLSIGCGTSSALFLCKRLPTFRRPQSQMYYFFEEYKNNDLVEEMKTANYIERSKWALLQHPADIVIIPQFDRPAAHQVRAEEGRSSVVYSTYIAAIYASLPDISRPCLNDAA